MKSICFIANFYKTPTFQAIADNLKNEGVSVFWMVPNRKQYVELSKIYGSENVLLIDRTIIDKPNSAIGDFKLNELIYGDRVWKYEMEKGLAYLTNLQKPVYDFIKNNHIKIVFGEDTWAQELLIHRMCNQLQELHCNFYSQMVTRIPNGKFHFFYDEKQYKTVLVKNTGVHAATEVKVVKPDYLEINNKTVQNAMSAKGVANRVKRFLTNENIDETDPNVITNQRIRVKVASQEVINQQRYGQLKRVSPEFVEGKKFVLFGFHKQPEASIDVCGRYFDDQFQNVLNIWRQLPPDWYLVIKEHSNAIGDRSYKFFKELLKYPRIVLMNEYANAQELMKKCQLVVTNTGTMALEAALQGIPAITLSKVVFNNLNYCRHCNWQMMEEYDSLEDLVNEIKSMPNNKHDYEDFVANYAFDGILTDIVTMPNVLNNENICNLVNAFLTLIKFNEER